MVQQALAPLHQFKVLMAQVLTVRKAVAVVVQVRLVVQMPHQKAVMGFLVP
jgi:hypothetical protein